MKTKLSQFATFCYLSLKQRRFYRQQSIIAGNESKCQKRSHFIAQTVQGG